MMLDRNETAYASKFSAALRTVSDKSSDVLLGFSYRQNISRTTLRDLDLCVQ
jgi:hypothetical protein